VARILMAWELGANLGHVDRQLLLARALRERGHEPVFVLRDLSRAHARVAVEGFRIGQAPVWLPRLNQPPRQGNFANVLAAAGWLDAPGLAGLLAGWQTWIDLLQPAAVLADHAPTALLAARGSGLPLWACGSAFEIPPALQGSFAPFRVDDARERAACNGYDHSVLPSVNAALGLLGRPPLARLTAIFDGVGKVLLTLPELAHYGDLGASAADVHWVGPLFAASSGADARWPDGPGPRAFVYVEPGQPVFEPLVAALQASGLRSLVHAKGLAEAAARRLSGPGLRFEPNPVRMDQALAGADLVVCHGGQGTLAAAALAGKPVLVLPTQLEQAMAARRVQACGWGLAVEPAGPPPTLAPVLLRLLREPGFAQAAQVVAQRHAGATPAATAQRVADLVSAGLGA
jgi:UDP-N-acetylglucosamine:LPS N-acetylglucosamine transferase